MKKILEKIVRSDFFHRFFAIPKYAISEEDIIDKNLLTNTFSENQVEEKPTEYHFVDTMIEKKYHLTEGLGEGAFNQVYASKHKEENLAIKVLPTEDIKSFRVANNGKDISCKDVAFLRFEREVECLARIKKKANQEIAELQSIPFERLKNFQHNDGYKHIISLHDSYQNYNILYLFPCWYSC